MLGLRSRGKAFGTPVRCPACHYPNVGINIWCERCRTPLDWQRGADNWAADPPVPEVARPEPPAAPVPPQTGPRVLAALRAPTLRPPPLTIPRLRMPALSMPTLSLARPAVPRLPRTAWIVAAVVAVLLMAPLAYVLFPAGRATAVRPGGSRASATTTATVPINSPEAAAIPGVEAKTGLRFSGTCKPNIACLSLASQMVGQEAAAVIFSTANPGGRQCAGYVYRRAGAWHLLNAVCALPGELSPLVGRDAIVHVPGNCANLRACATVNGRVAGCLYAA